MWSLVFGSAWAFIGSGLYLPLCSLHSQGAGGSFLIFENIKGKKKSKGSRLSCCSGPSTPLICLTQGGKGYTCAEGGGGSGGLKMKMRDLEKKEGQEPTCARNT